MNRKIFAAAAVAGTVMILVCTGTVLAKNVFAAEDKITITGDNPEGLQASVNTKALTVYKNGKYGDTGCTLILPEGYVPDQTRKGMYISERFPVDSSNIFYTVSEGIDTNSLRESLVSGKYEEKAKKRFEEAYGSNAVLNSCTFESSTVDGCPAYIIRLSVTADQMTMEQLIYMVVADKTYTVTYSQAVDDERMSDFEQSAKSIRVIFDTEE